MKKFLTTKYLILSFLLIYLFIFSSFFLVTSFLSSSNIIESDFEVGFVKVDVEAFFIKNGIEYRTNLDYDVEYDEQVLFTKTGVLKVNVNNLEDIKFLTNFRVNINVSSNILTYFRVAPYEQLTLTYSIGETIREVAVTQKNYMPFNYNVYKETNPANENCFVDRREFDGFLYYMTPVKRVSKTEDLKITLIGEFLTSQSYQVYDDRYSMQIGFIIEAVQAYLGPENNWGLAKKPWDNSNWSEVA